MIEVFVQDNMEETGGGEGQYSFLFDNASFDEVMDVVAEYNRLVKNCAADHLRLHDILLSKFSYQERSWINIVDDDDGATVTGWGPEER